jgi:hypothetical protein
MSNGSRINLKPYLFSDCKMEIDMRKIGLVCITLMLLGSVSPNAAWARGGHFHGGGLALGLGLGLLGGYGLGYGFYGRLPYYPPYYGYAPAYGPPGYGYGGFAPYGYGYAPAYPPVVTVPSAPVVIQQQPQVVQSPPPASVPAPATNYWHYCRKPDGYYPYVKNCPGGWLQVAPQPIQ